MTQSELEQFKLKIKQDYVKLLDLLARVLAADNYLSFGDVNDNERLSIARGLTDKFVNHAVTLLYLSRGTKQDLPSFKCDSYLYDFASIDVLTRVLLEACLIFHYVFYSPQTTEEKDYRYWAYKAAAILERQGFRESSEEVKRSKAEDAKELDKLHERLRSNTVFRSLTDKQKEKILKGEWRLKSWREIAIDAGFSKTMASKIYRHLSGSAHSSFLSVFLSVETQKSGTQEEAIIGSQGIANAVIANMVREYCGLFPKAHEIWSTHPEVREFVEWWIQIDRTLDEFNK
jgi:hypothetical protein